MISKHVYEIKGIRGVINNPLVLITLIIGFFSLIVTIIYIDQPILEAHGFRQTQTALTAYYLLHEGWQLNYQTPVAGYPWSIPFEFPIYQSLVAFISLLGGFNLDSIGRFVSFGLLLAYAWPAINITERLNLSKDVGWIFCALLWSSPLYLFYGRSFMIETAALFFSLCAIPYFIDLLNSKPDWKSLIPFSIWMTMGLLQKITTAAPVMLIFGIIFLFDYLKTNGLKMIFSTKTTKFFIAFIIPTFFGGFWSIYSDFIRSRNLLGMQLLSKTLTKWNFGTLQQRVDLHVLKTIFWDRAILDNAGGILGIMMLICLVLFAEKRVKIIVGISILMFILPVYLFINLHFIHDYYQISSTIFLIFGLAVSIKYAFQKFSKHNLIVLTLSIIFVSSNLLQFINGYANYMKAPIDEINNQTLAVSDIVRTYTDKNSAIVVFGYDWNSEIAYYSERKSFTVPEWFIQYNDVWNDPAAFLGDKKLGAVIYCGIEITEKPKFMQYYESTHEKSPKLIKTHDCLIWIPEVTKTIHPNEKQESYQVSVFHD